MYSAMVAERAICRQTASVNGVNKCERIAAGEPCLEPQLIERHDDTSALAGESECAGAGTSVS